MPQESKKIQTRSSEKFMIIFRTIGGPIIGYGHVYRCLSLAAALRQLANDIYITFIVNEEISGLVRNDKFDVIVSDNFDHDEPLFAELKPLAIILDAYTASNTYLSMCKNYALTVLFDDNNDIYDDEISDIIINGNIHAGDLNYSITDSIRLLGPKYLVLRKEYWGSHVPKMYDKKGILVTTGGSDKYDSSVAILQALKLVDTTKTVVVGPGYKLNTIANLEGLKDCNTRLVYKPSSLLPLLEQAEYTISAAGSTVYEILLQKSIPILFSIATNQDKAYDSFTKLGVYGIGKYPNIDYYAIPSIIKDSPDRAHQQLFDIIDREGASRVAQVILSAIHYYSNCAQI